MKKENSLENLFWLELPEDMDTDLGIFKLDVSIPLPIEPDQNGKVSMEDASWEKFIAAMLLVLAVSPSHEYAGYYRNLLKALRPSLQEELEEAYKEKINYSDWDEAEDIILALRGLEPENLNHQYSMALLYDRLSAIKKRDGNFEASENYENAAEAAYSELLSNPDAPDESWFSAGVFRYRTGKYAEALETLESYISGPSGSKNKAEALRLIRLCRDEGQADKLYTDAYNALKSGRIEEGVELAREFLKEKNKSWPGYFLLGWGLRLGEHWSEAREALENALEKGCRETDLYNELAICARAVNDLDGAAEYLEKALRNDPENIKIVSNMSLVLLEKGDLDEALKWAKTSLTLDPEDPVSKKIYKDITGREEIDF